MIKNKKELLNALENKHRVSGDTTALALAYLVSDICPNDRTTRHVFRKKAGRG